MSILLEIIREMLLSITILLPTLTIVHLIFVFYGIWFMVYGEVLKSFF